MQLYLSPAIERVGNYAVEVCEHGGRKIRRNMITGETVKIANVIIDATDARDLTAEFTHEELAQASGCSRSQVNRALSRMRKLSWLETTRTGRSTIARWNSGVLVGSIGQTPHDARNRLGPRIADQPNSPENLKRPAVLIRSERAPTVQSERAPANPLRALSLCERAPTVQSERAPEGPGRALGTPPNTVRNARTGAGAGGRSLLNSPCISTPPPLSGECREERGGVGGALVEVKLDDRQQAQLEQLEQWLSPQKALALVIQAHPLIIARNITRWRKQPELQQHANAGALAWRITTESKDEALIRRITEARTRQPEAPAVIGAISAYEPAAVDPRIRQRAAERRARERQGDAQTLAS